MDHQARICHSTTVSGVAILGLRGDDELLQRHAEHEVRVYIGSNAAEAHPVSMVHMRNAKENGAKLIVADPRRTRTAAKSDLYIRFRSGTDIPVLFGMLYHIFKKAGKTSSTSTTASTGMERFARRCSRSGRPTRSRKLPASRVPCSRRRRDDGEEPPVHARWCMGQTQHSIGNAMVRALVHRAARAGKRRHSGGGANIFAAMTTYRRHRHRTEPRFAAGYYVSPPVRGKHFAAVWGVDYDWMIGQFARA